MAQSESLIEYPCAFPIKIMGVADGVLVETVLAIVCRHDPQFDAGSMERRSSATGKYLSLTCTITATSRVQLDALYLELTGNPLVKVVL